MPDKKRKSISWRGIIVYVLLVIVTGFTLNATGHFDNPITAIVSSLGPEGSKGSEGKAPRNSTDTRPGEDAGNRDSSTQDHSESDVNKIGATTTGDPTQTHEEAESVNWSRLGDVFFDLWFIAMVTAVIVVMQQIGSLAMQRLNKRPPPISTQL